MPSDRRPRADEERFDALVEAMLGRPGTTYGAGDAGPQRAFGATSLKTNGKIFAMLVNGGLVIKLEAQRVDALVAEGVGTRFDPGHGRLMKEWLAIDEASDDAWFALATESEASVARRRQGFFPQLADLGRSERSRMYAISGLDEATAYLAHPILGARLRACAEAVLGNDERTAEEILGSIDAVKLRSCMTLFHRATPNERVFAEVLQRFYAGVEDDATTTRLGLGR